MSAAVGEAISLDFALLHALLRAVPTDGMAPDFVASWSRRDEVSGCPDEPCSPACLADKTNHGTAARSAYSRSLRNRSEV